LVLNLVRAARAPERLADYPGLNDLEEQLPQPEVQANARLWFADDQPVAFAFVDPWDNLWFDTLPAHEAALGDEIVQFGVECVRARLEGEPGTLETNCAEANAARRAFLEAHGFTTLPEQTLTFARPLSGPIPDPVLPPGYLIRLLKGREEAEAAAALHRAAFGSDYMTTENRLAMMETSEYCPEMDLVAVTPDGELAAYAMGFIPVEENAKTGRREGCVDPIATHPDHQRLGLARALLLTGMRMLQKRGMETVKFGTSSENVGMQKTAAACGFQVESRKFWFRQEVNP
jgi:ribosomal protein S18 acetylase RimI-like enzyme